LWDETEGRALANRDLLDLCWKTENKRALMSGHGDPHEEAHEADDHEHADLHHAPPPPEEPATPLWFTLLGVALFLAFGIAFVATRTGGKTTAELTAQPSAQPAGSATGAPQPAVRP
jgi:hypothetical protein